MEWGLCNPAELKGKIAFGDPVNSSSAFQSLLAMLYGMGKDGDPLSDEAWAYVDQFIANLDGKMANSSSQVYKGVAEGEYVVGLTWEDPGKVIDTNSKNKDGNDYYYVVQKNGKTGKIVAVYVED